MNPHETRGGPLHNGEGQGQPDANGGSGGLGGMHGGHGHGAAMAAPPWAAHMAPWHAPHPYHYGYPYGSGTAPGWGPPGWAPAGWAAAGAAPTSAPGTPALGILNNRFVMGMLVGGALTYVLTNEAIQRAAIRGVMQIWLGIQGGIEETKERFRDAESEIKAARHG